MSRDCEVFQPLNTKLLLKREETEKLIRNEYSKVKTLLLDKQKNHAKRNPINSTQITIALKFCVCIYLYYFCSDFYSSKFTGRIE